MSKSTGSTAPKDHWSSEKYKASASFVPSLATKILEWLDPQPSDRILDIGCGDGKFTSRFIPAVTCSDGEIYGIDSSTKFVEEASSVYGRDVAAGKNKFGTKQQFDPISKDGEEVQDREIEAEKDSIRNPGTEQSGPKISFKVVDARNLDQDPYAVNGSWDKVISNAALHWILAVPRSSPKTTINTIAAAATTTATEKEEEQRKAGAGWRAGAKEKEIKRQQIFQTIYDSLKSNGKSKFVFEFGGAGNVAEVVSVVAALLVRDGLVAAGSSIPDSNTNNNKNNNDASSKAENNIVSSSGSSSGTGSATSTTPANAITINATTPTIDEVIPWFFPDVQWTKTTLERVGFRVDVCELVDRPTRLNEVQTDNHGNFIGGGVEGWVRLMLAGVIDFYAEKRGEEFRERFVREIVDAVEVVADRAYGGTGEGGMWLRYVRLRGVATKI